MCALILTALALGVFGTAGQAATAAPKLRIVALNPMAIRGSGFAARERVKLLIVAPRPAVRWVRASARGMFSIRLRFKVGRCEAVVVQAVGARGSRAQAELLRPDCAAIPG